MGMDVYGESPRSETGEYFRNNVWWWRPLWDYCRSVAKDIIPDDVFNAGHCNDGAGLDDVNSIKLAEILEKEIASNRTLIFEKKYMGDLEKLPDEQCNICHGTGKRNDQFVRGECNACHGKGTKRPSATWYPFSVENVKQFAAFLRECGGFRIC